MGLSQLHLREWHNYKGIGMRLKLHHTPYVSRRITRDLISCDFIEVRKEKASIEEQVVENFGWRYWKKNKP